MISPNDEPPPPEKQLRFASFARHAARGLIRDQKARRQTMFYIVLVALLMLFCGATFLAPVLNPKEHPGWFISYWAVCGWITATAVLLAIFDLLLVRAQGRALRGGLAEKLADSDSADDAD
jgi:hypothetical protein